MKLRFATLSLALLMPALASAGVIYTVSLNTDPLVGHGPFTLDLQFLDGSGLPADLNNNTIMLTDFQFGTGSPSGGGTVTCSPGTCGVTGSLASGITMKDTVFFNEYDENFTPGSHLSFTLDTTNNLDSGGTPDEFSLAILDSFGNELPTNGPASEFLDIVLGGGANPTVSPYGSAPGAAFSLAAPVVVPQSAVPEPSSVLLLAIGFGGLCFVARSKGRLH